jgi:hypothetical protein
MQAYDMLAIEYYHMNDIERSRMYQDRVTRGMVERKDSVIRNVSVNVLASKREKLSLGFNINSHKK